ncbi:MAG: hypothetical protein LBU88_08910 [Treponema sp.]|nr:hypothetical protein [Treponema sp.]
MKKKLWLKAIGCVFIALTLTLSLTGCPPSPGGGGGGGGGEKTNVFSVAGTFVKGVSDTVKFKLSDAGSSGKSAGGAESYAVSGELVDGNIIFQLEGYYDPVTRTYTASSAGSFIRFSISGAFNASGNSLGSTATVAMKMDQNDENSWVVASYTVTEEAVTFSGTETANAFDGTGAPAQGRGLWKFADSQPWDYWDPVTQEFKEGTMSFAGTLLVSEWTMVVEQMTTYPDGTKDFHTMNLTVVEVDSSNNNYDDIIVSFPMYVGTKAQVLAAAAAFLQQINISATQLNASPYPSGDWLYVYPSGSIGGSLPEYLWEEIFALNLTGNQSEVKQAIQQYFDDNFIDYVEILDEAPNFPTSPCYWYEEEWDDISWSGFSQSQWVLIDQWWRTNFLERHLIKAGVAPISLYQKWRATFANGKMYLKFFMDDGDEMFDLAATRALTDAHIVEEEEMEFER